MMARFTRPLLASLSVLIAVAAWPGAAVADDPPGAHVTLGDNKGDTSFDGSVSTDPQGVTLQVGGTQSVPAGGSPPPSAPGGSTPGGPGGPGEPPGGEPAPPSDPGGRQPTGFTPIPFSVDPAALNLPGSLAGTIPYPGTIPPPPAPGAPPANTPAGPGSGAPITPRDIAVSALARIPLPSIAIRANPSLGLVNLPNWFWADGYDGRPFGASRSVSLPPEVGPEVPTSVVPANDPRRQTSTFTVEVRVSLAQCAWRFGDGATLVTQSLGEPYPAESDVRHTYQYASLAFPDGFPVSLTVSYEVEYLVNGGAPRPLAPIRRMYQGRIRVREAQPVLTQR
jgi:hypothetical protein